MQWLNRLLFAGGGGGGVRIGDGTILFYRSAVFLTRTLSGSLGSAYRKYVISFDFT